MQAKLPAGEPSPRAAFYFIEFIEPVGAAYVRPAAFRKHSSALYGRAGHTRPLQGNSYLVILVIIDEASIGQDLPLGIGHSAEADCKANYAAVRLYGDGGQLVIGIQQGLAHAGQVDVIAVGQHVGRIQEGRAACPS